MCLVLSQRHELWHPLGPPPLPQPEPGLQGAPCGAQVPMTGAGAGGQISIMHCPLTIA
jgi:hypothetical protein